MTYGYVYGLGEELNRAMRKMAAPKSRRYVRTGRGAKLTDDEVREIRREYAKDSYDPVLFCCIVAEAHGMCWMYIRELVNYKVRVKRVRTDPHMIPLI